MVYQFADNKYKSLFRIIEDEQLFDRQFFTRDRKEKLLTIAWNRGPQQTVVIDEVKKIFPSNCILPLMVNQSFSFSTPSQITAWQFNREFYCVINHDKEVSCVGFLFYGSLDEMFIEVERQYQQKLESLLQVFKDEMETADNIQQQMLQMLLARLIIIVTRLAKKQYLPGKELDSDKFDLFRQFNLLVEHHYKREHEVQFYAAALHKSPKTLANVFALYDKETPLQVIGKRITLEAKRLFFYTDKSAKEVAAELGFEDAAHFSRFFKKQTGYSPSDFRKIREEGMQGKIIQLSGTMSIAKG